MPITLIDKVGLLISSIIYKILSEGIANVISINVGIIVQIVSRFCASIINREVDLSISILIIEKATNVIIIIINIIDES